jgi:hypothetical protein
LENPLGSLKMGPKSRATKSGVVDSNGVSGSCPCNQFPYLKDFYVCN